MSDHSSNGNRPNESGFAYGVAMLPGQIAIASEMWSAGSDTMDIAIRLGLPEFIIWNWLPIIRSHAHLLKNSDQPV